MISDSGARLLAAGSEALITKVRGLGPLPALEGVMAMEGHLAGYADESEANFVGWLCDERRTFKVRTVSGLAEAAVERPKGTLGRTRHRVRTRA